MSTKLFLIAALLLFFIACKQNKPSQSNAQQNTPIKLKTCKIYSSDFVLLDPNDKGQLMQEFRFNKLGYVNELIRYGLDGEILGTFDIRGQNNPFPFPEKPSYFDTVLTVLTIDSLDIIKQKEVKIYNTQGLLIETRFYNETNNLTRKNTFTYDTLGLIQQDLYWDIELNKPKQMIRYEYEFNAD
jgi:hypothetical protein